MSRLPDRRTSLAASLRLASLSSRSALAVYVMSVTATLYLLSLSTPDIPSEQWLILEAFFIPLGVLLSAGALVARYERGELELLLARRSARQLFLILVAPALALLLLSSTLISLLTAVGGPLEAAARVLVLFGFTHLTINLSRSLWFGLTWLGLWWLIGFVFMTPWAESTKWAVAIWHPMRLSGGGQIRMELELLAICLGALLSFGSWFAVGRDGRWLT
jgi:hypothetical protein